MKDLRLDCLFQWLHRLRKLIAPRSSEKKNEKKTKGKTERRSLDRDRPLKTGSGSLVNGSFINVHKQGPAYLTADIQSDT